MCDPNDEIRAFQGREERKHTVISHQNKVECQRSSSGHHLACFVAWWRCFSFMDDGRGEFLVEVLCTCGS